MSGCVMCWRTKQVLRVFGKSETELDVNRVCWLSCSVLHNST